MRKFLIPIAVGASALCVAAPATAQWAPPVYRYAPYHFGSGFSGFHFARSMQARVQRIRADIRAMAVRRMLSPSEARALDREARALERRIFRASRFGINPVEARSLEFQIRHLEVRVAREASDWDRRPGRHRY
jgi:hypothetical protein